MMFKTKYRIVTDMYNGYEAQRRVWWFPFWLQIGINTHHTIEEAKYFLSRKKHYVVYTE